jgi:hypothetical protein
MPRCCHPALLLLLAGCSSAPAPLAAPGDWQSMAPLVPRGYVCRLSTTPLTIDGRDDEAAWATAAWTDDFVDIEGPKKPNPRFRTRAKMLWDDTYFYIFARMEEPHVWGTLTQKNAVIYHDNDFEVFIDPDGDNIDYYEFEMNALNTIWELTMPRPYKDGGNAVLGTNLPGLKSAVSISGTLNNPSDTDKEWCVEIAIPWSDLKRYAGAMSAPPREGETWRMGFSRVEWIVDIIDGKYRKIPREMRPEDNWVWSPQGVVDMHRPERWGAVRFVSAAVEVRTPEVPYLRERDRMMELYYRQRAFHAANKRYAATVEELGITAMGNGWGTPHIELTTEGYTATHTFYGGSTEPPTTIHVRQDSKLWMDPPAVRGP